MADTNTPAQLASALINGVLDQSPDMTEKADLIGQAVRASVTTYSGLALAWTALSSDEQVTLLDVWEEISRQADARGWQQ